MNTHIRDIPCKAIKVTTVTTKLMQNCKRQNTYFSIIKTHGTLKTTHHNFDSPFLGRHAFHYTF